MRVKIYNMLVKSDFRDVAEFLKEKPNKPLTLLYSHDANPLEVESLDVVSKQHGYGMSSGISFYSIPLPPTLNFDTSTTGIKVDAEDHEEWDVPPNVSLSLDRPFVNAEVLKDDTDSMLRLLERIANTGLDYHDIMVKREIRTLDSKQLLEQMKRADEEKEIQNYIEKRVLVREPFATIHARNIQEAIEIGGGLTPLYREYDKYSLMEGRKVYFLLPHDFVMKLLKCLESGTVNEDRFSEKEREVLQDLLKKGYIKKHQGSIVSYYYGLDKKTAMRIAKRPRPK